ncbi:MAG: DUF3798 domain-containing protein [Desulfobulbaceae bacterium]|nr:DUF3798 domain-containing protein [Desulfobulbaceae bacterium]
MREFRLRVFAVLFFCSVFLPVADGLAAAFHIGLMTGSGVQSSDEMLAARKLIDLYGDANHGGMVRHITYPDNFLHDMETTIGLLVALADDPLMKVIIACQAVPGTADAFRQIKIKRPDILCLAAESQEDTRFIGTAADLLVNSDFVARGYLIPYAAKLLGAKTFVHISFPRHMINETMGRRRLIMERACDDLGLRFVYEKAPDPTGVAGIDGARRYITEQVPKWLKLYGKDTAFFCTNDAHTEPLLRQLAAHGGYFIEADMPSLLMGYPAAFGITLNQNSDDWGALLKNVEQSVVKAGASGRMGVWAAPLAYADIVALTEFGRMVVMGQAKKNDMRALLACYEKASPNGAWQARRYIDRAIGKTMNNCLLIRQDTYIFGKGFLGLTDTIIPDKYLATPHQ